MIGRLLPECVAHAEAYEDLARSTLFPDELAQIAHAVDKRRREYATVRRCARLALDALGVAPAPLVADERGAPLWPPGIVGSMTHCDGYRAAAVARTSDLRSIGIDAEPHEPLPPTILPMIARQEDRAMVAGLAAIDSDVHWDRLLFCAKEAIDKAWFPLARRWLDFAEAAVRLDPTGTFAADLVGTWVDVDGERITSFHGRWQVDRGLAMTAVADPDGRPATGRVP